MPVCKFFLRGNCRKGNNCTFDHVLPEENYGTTRGGGTSVLRRDDSSVGNDSYSDYRSYETYSSRKYDDRRFVDYNERNVDGHLVTIGNEYYSDRSSGRQYDQRYNQAQRYHNDRYHYDPRQTHIRQQSHQKQPDITVDEIYVLLKSDISVIESSQIWPLTSFCIVKLFGSLEDWVDYSPEELRFAAYLAKAANNFDGYKSSHDKVVSKAQALRNFYKTSSKECSAKIKSYIKQEATTIHPLLDNELDFSHVNYPAVSFSLNSTSDFASSQPIPFGEPPSHTLTEDMEMASVSKPENVFGSSQTINSSNSFPFSQEAKQSDVFGFSQNQNTSNNTFGFAQKSAPPSENVFGRPSDSSFGFGQSTRSDQFHQRSKSDQPPKALTSLFPRLSQTDLDVEILSFVWRGDSPYSRSADLTDEEHEQFKASRFTVGKVPLVPPPKDLC